MKITVLTLFPKLFDNFLNESIVKKIIQKKIVKIQIVDFRQFSKEKTKRVDDYQYGGGAGMVIQLPATVEAIKKYKTKNTKVVLLSPQGQPYSQIKARQLSKNKDLILIAGHYEGFDERLINYVDEVVSIGDYILTGGEIPTMVLIETIIRLQDKAINNESLINETFDNNLLDYPVYTKPLKYDGYEVPKVLLSGNHKLIKEYRLQQQILKTKKYRNDMYKKYLKENKNAKTK
ncbi:MAG: tRNA (guanosine(37)-N1)-methyltransferase TrmD [Mycoplasmataceae bacterium]|jgi:tRNA (guanine37-N1)-methyltransferase|nr:tRNA (guanosine(37)-N1)-methyltransferase TrmD [Mycoplasmataceae bacterium]